MMESLKRFYLNLLTTLGFTFLSHPMPAQPGENDASNRVSRDVNYYRTHFFNL